MKMISRQAIRKVSRRIAEEFRPERIVLFGSYAYGRPSAASDVDLLVVMPFRGHSSRKAVEILSAVDPRFALDLIVRDPRQLRRRIREQDWFLTEIMERGEVLHQTSSPNPRRSVRAPKAHTSASQGRSPWKSRGPSSAR